MREIILSGSLLFLSGCATIGDTITDWSCERCDRENVCYVQPHLDIDYPSPLTLLDVHVNVYQMGERVGVWMDKNAFDNWMLNNKSCENTIILHRDVIRDYKEYYRLVE